MDFSELTQYLSPLILIICAGVGYSLHSLNNKILNSFLPIISGTLGVLIAVWSFNDLAPQTVAMGLTSGLASTGMYEAFKNILNLPATYQVAAIEIPYGENNKDGGAKGKHSA